MHAGKYSTNHRIRLNLERSVLVSEFNWSLDTIAYQSLSTSGFRQNRELIISHSPFALPLYTHSLRLDALCQVWTYIINDSRHISCYLTVASQLLHSKCTSECGRVQSVLLYIAIIIPVLRFLYIVMRVRCIIQ